MPVAPNDHGISRLATGTYSRWPDYSVTKGRLQAAKSCWYAESPAIRSSTSQMSANLRYIDLAKAILLSEQRVSASLIQRRLTVGYSTATSILADLEAEGFVTPLFDGVRRLVDEQPDTEARANVLRAAFEMVRFFWEMWEEDSAGDTRTMNLLKYPLKLDNVELRAFILGCFKTHGMSLVETAIALIDRCRENTPLPALSDDDLGELAIMCTTATRPFEKTTDPSAIESRSFVRLARYLVRKGHGAHSRSFECFLNGAYRVPTGYGALGPGQEEHVVPLAYIRRHCVEQIAAGASYENAASDIKRLLAVVHIRKEQSAMLDASVASGGYGWKVEMPKGWCPKTGDIYARLVQAGIEFTPPV